MSSSRTPPGGAGPQNGSKTHALPSIWRKGDDFAKLAKSAIVEAGRPGQVAARMDVTEMKAQAFAMGDACRHDHRSKDYGKDAEEQ